MNELPIYLLLSTNAAVNALLHDSTLNPPRLRAWGFGYAPEELVDGGDGVKPYVVWSVPVDEPENMLTCDPSYHHVTYQFDVYARKGEDANEINTALQYALRPHGYIEAIRPALFDQNDTKLFQAGFDLLYIQMR